jgi:toxin ParE1/3/4
MRQIKIFIAKESSIYIARRYIARLKSFCADLSLAPYRGEPRPGLQASLRSIGFDRRISVVFEISKSEHIVRIVSFHYAGRAWNEHA